MSLVGVIRRKQGKDIARESVQISDTGPAGP